MKKTTIFLLLYLLIATLLTAQSDDIQQLITEAQNSADNTRKVDLQVQIGDRLLLTDVKKAEDYAEKALKLAKKLKYADGQAKAQLVIGKAYLEQNKLRKSIDNLELAKKWAEANHDTLVLYDLYFQLAKAYQVSKKPTEVELYRQKIYNLKQRQENLSNQDRIKLLEIESSANKDSALLARLSAIEAQMVRDSALEQISVKEAALLKQRVALSNLEKEAAEFKQQKAESELRLQRQQAALKQQQQRFYWVLVAFVFVVVLGLGGWFYYQSRQARKLAKIERLEAERLRILTAGIAHEIKNPLNFVNNFAEGSVEITQELEEVLTDNQQDIKPQQFSVIAELLGELKQNSVDIRKNGQRVHQIVQSMTDYAGGGKNERQATDLNQLLDENINLAYHGYRAQHPDFIANIERKYDALLTPIELIPQEMGRVFLNLVNNACYALHQKRKELNNHYTPTLTIATASQNGEVMVKIRDNGIGIPKEVRDKIFTPFFTTKPTGAGNSGLGLSISYEIVTQHHHGSMEVETQPGDFTEFIIRLPKNREV
ncbi:MAG: sensor histidine kinase [Saprospiraceae bacterium]